MVSSTSNNVRRSVWGPRRAHKHLLAGARSFTYEAANTTAAPKAGWFLMMLAEKKHCVAYAVKDKSRRIRRAAAVEWVKNRFFRAIGILVCLFVVAFMPTIVASIHTVFAYAVFAGMGIFCYAAAMALDMIWNSYLPSLVMTWFVGVLLGSVLEKFPRLQRLIQGPLDQLDEHIPSLKWSRNLLFGVPGQVFLRFCSYLLCGICLTLWCMGLVDEGWQRQELRQIEAPPPDSPEPEPQTPPPRAPPPPFPDVSPPRRRNRRGSSFGVRRRTGRIQRIPI